MNEKLIFYKNNKPKFTDFLIKTQMTRTFKEELNSTVNKVRDSLKSGAIMFFTQLLKSEMLEVATEGKTSGSIVLNDILFPEGRLLKLQKILIYTDEIESEDQIFSWLLKEVKRTSFFDEINIIILDDYILEFNWND